MIGVAAIWGGTFVLVQDAVERIPPFLYLALRFSLGTAVLALAGGFRGLTPRERRSGALIGVALFGGYAFQTVGLQYTTASNAGFITGMFVVFTPLIGALALRTLPTAAASTGALLAGAGLGLLAGGGSLRLGLGDALEVCTAITFAVHILMIARLGEGTRALQLTSMQVATTAALATIWSVAAERAPIPGADGVVWFAVAFNAVFATALAFGVQTRAQRTIPPVRTAVILTAEPVFAGIFGYAIAGDRLGAAGYAGAALILCGILVAEIFARERERL